MLAITRSFLAKPAVYNRPMPLIVSPPLWTGSPGVLDREAFRSTFTVLAADIPANKTGAMLKAKALNGYMNKDLELYYTVS